MMGTAVGRQDRLFYSFNLEDRVPADHLLRQIDAVLDLSWLRGALAPFYSHTGCPSVDPVLLIRMLLVGYCYSIRSERRLCQEVELNLAFRWFCGLGLEDAVPDHSTFSVNRHGRFRDSDILRRVFEQVVDQCVTAGLVGGEGFAVDAGHNAHRPIAGAGRNAVRFWFLAAAQSRVQAVHRDDHGRPVHAGERLGGKSRRRLCLAGGARRRVALGGADGRCNHHRTGRAGASGTASAAWRSSSTPRTRAKVFENMPDGTLRKSFPAFDSKSNPLLNI